MHRTTIRRALAAGVAPVALAGLLLTPGLGQAAGQRADMPTITATAKGFVAAVPMGITAGMVRFTYTNNGGTWQGIGLGLLKAGASQAQVTSVLKTGNPEGLDALGVPYGGVGAGMGATETMVATLPAGRYVLYDTETDSKGKPLYAAKFFTIGSGFASAGMAPAPSTAASITLKDMKFVSPDSLPAGTHTFKIHNGGPSEHMMVTFKIAKGKTYQDVLAFLKGGEKGQPPIDQTTSGGFNVMGPGQTAYLTETFTPGTYVMVCFVTDKKKNIPHVAEGMIKKITVS
jgi:hypothetical protein